MKTSKTSKTRKPIQVRLSDEEREILDRAADREGGSIAAILRGGGLVKARAILGE